MGDSSSLSTRHSRERRESPRHTMVDAEARGASPRPPRLVVSRYAALAHPHPGSAPARALTPRLDRPQTTPRPNFRAATPADTSEIGKLAVWSVTSAKPGNGVELLRDGNLDTYWQSDGAQPHLINVQFQRKVKVREIALYADYKLDESYTPSKISVRAGNSFHDLREVRVVDLDEPVGWTRVRLDKSDESDESDGAAGAPLRAYFLQIAVLSNHQNGRDTHVRQVKIFGPRTSPMAMLGNGVSFTTPEFAQFATVR